RHADAGLRQPAFFRDGPAQAQYVDGHAALPAGVAADLFAQALGEAVEVGGVGSNLLVLEVARRQRRFLVDRHTARIDGVRNARRVRGLQGDIETFHVGVQRTGHAVYVLIVGQSDLYVASHRHVEQRIHTLRRLLDGGKVAGVALHILQGTLVGRAQIENTQRMVLRQHG